MKKSIGALLALSSLLAPQIAAAECGGGECHAVKISYMYVASQYATWVSTTGDESLLSCTPNQGNLLKVNPTDSKSDWLYTFLLTAHLQNLTVYVRLNPDLPECTIAYVTTGTL